MLRNRACEGWVVHRRGSPAHAFRYRVWMALVDMAQLAAERSPLLGSRWPRALALRPADYLNVSGDVLRGVNTLLADRTLAPCDRVFVLTQPRSWGFFFNPVNFYFCCAGGRLHYVLAEINNTPWNEKHVYVLDARDQDQGKDLELRFAKEFHVSPFLPMNLDYRWGLCLTDDSVRIAMGVLDDGREVFSAGLYLSTSALDASSLARGRYRYALQNLRTLARIYWQAARLYLRGTAFHQHPRHSTEATTT